MRFLIIENDLALQAAIEKRLNPFGTCRVAKDRESGLVMIREAIGNNQAFDLVIIDIEMPGAQKESVMSAIRATESDLSVPTEKQTCLISIASSYNRQLITDCMMQGCDECLLRDFDAERFVAVLKQLNLIGKPIESKANPAVRFDGNKIVDLIRRKIKSGKLHLPPAPRVAMRIRQLVGSGAELATIVELLRQDLAISTKLISVSNSVAYGGVSKNTDVGQAVSRLGLDRAVEVVMSICCRGYFVTGHMGYMQRVEDLWWHSLACAHAAEMIIREQHLTVQEDVFSLALLHDLGKLVLIQAASELYKPTPNQLDINFDALDAIMQEHHERFGMMLLEKWGYSKAFAALIQHHPVATDGTRPMAAQVLHQADLLVAAAGFDDANGNVDGIGETLKAMGYSVERQAEIAAGIAERIEQLRYLFG